MNRVLKFVLIVLLFTFSSFISLDEVVSAIKKGNASQLSKFFDNTIEITVVDKKNTYSKSQAELVLKDFFDNSAVKDFLIIHKGDNSGTQFLTGVLQTKSGEYRTTIYMKQKGNKNLLQELRFEK